MGNNFEDLHPAFKQSLSQLMAVCNVKTGGTWRSHDEQAQLKAQKPELAATPGKSNHEHMMDDGTPASLAADISGDLTCAHALAPRYGLRFPMAHEPWHIEPANLTELRTGRTATIDYSGEEWAGVVDPDAYTPAPGGGEPVDEFDAKARQLESFFNVGDLGFGGMGMDEDAGSPSVFDETMPNPVAEADLPLERRPGSTPTERDRMI